MDVIKTEAKVDPLAVQSCDGANTGEASSSGYVSIKIFIPNSLSLPTHTFITMKRFRPDGLCSLGVPNS